MKNLYPKGMEDGIVLYSVRIAIALSHTM
jgi:hypothetical protein